MKNRWDVFQHEKLQASWESHNRNKQKKVHIRVVPEIYRRHTRDPQRRYNKRSISTTHGMSFYLERTVIWVADFLQSSFEMIFLFFVLCITQVNWQDFFPLKLSHTFKVNDVDVRVAELGSLSSGAKMAMKIFVKRVFTIFAINASFLRKIANLQI